MGTRLATLRGFRFRVPLLEVRGVWTIRVRHIRLISAHIQAVAVPMCFKGVPPDPSSRTWPLPRVKKKKLRVPLPVTEARCECGVLDCRGRHRAGCPHSGRLCTGALAPERTPRKSLPGSRRNCSMQRKVGRHEHRCGHRESRGVRPSIVPWSSVGRGHHSEVCPDHVGDASPWSCCCERHCVRRSTSGQGKEVRRAAFWRWKLEEDGVPKPWTIWWQLEHGKLLLSSNGPFSSLGNGGGLSPTLFTLLPHALAGVDGSVPDFADLLGEV